VETIFGNQQGGRKGHNTKYRGKKALRPILCFIDETREYLLGNLRKGQTVRKRRISSKRSKVICPVVCIKSYFAPMVNF
jgi:hypothetical protein